MIRRPVTGGGGAVSSVAGRTGAVTLAKADVGLSNVDNTSDATKLAAANAAAAIAAIDPAQAVISDDLINANVASGSSGSLGWSHFQGTFTALPSEANHPGIFEISTSATITTVASMELGTLTICLLPADIWDMTWIIRTVSVDTDTAIRIGMSSNPSSNPAANHICFEKLYADTNWFRNCRSGGSQTRTDTGIAVAAGWSRYRLRRIDASTIGFTIGANAEQTLTANIPTAQLVPSITIVNQTAVAKLIDVDWFSLAFTGLAR